MKLNKTEEAKLFFQKVIATYPESAEAFQAKGRLARMEELQKTSPTLALSQNPKDNPPLPSPAPTGTPVYKPIMKPIPMPGQPTPKGPATPPTTPKTPAIPNAPAKPPTATAPAPAPAEPTQTQDSGAPLF